MDLFENFQFLWQIRAKLYVFFLFSFTPLSVIKKIILFFPFPAHHKYLNYAVKHDARLLSLIAVIWFQLCVLGRLGRTRS